MQAKGGIGGASDVAAKSLSQCKELLEHHGRFLLVRLYPKNLLTKLDLVKNSEMRYYELYKEINELGYKAVGRDTFRMWAVMQFLGYRESADNYNEELLKPERDFLSSLRTANPKLVERFTIECKKLSEATRNLSKAIEDFYFDNQLEQVRERNPSPYGVMGSY